MKKMHAHERFCTDLLKCRHMYQQIDFYDFLSWMKIDCHKYIQSFKKGECFLSLQNKNADSPFLICLVPQAVAFLPQPCDPDDA